MRMDLDIEDELWGEARRVSGAESDEHVVRLGLEELIRTAAARKVTTYRASELDADVVLPKPEEPS